MPGPVKTYDPAAIICNFAGVPITGFAEGTFVSAERDADAYTKYVGSTGEVARGRSRNLAGMVTFTLIQTSDTNTFLDALAQGDELNNSGSGPLLVKDVLGNTLLTCNTAWIRKRPTVEFGDEVGTREWIIDCGEMVFVVGGSNV